MLIVALIVFSLAAYALIGGAVFALLDRRFATQADVMAAFWPVTVLVLVGMKLGGRLARMQPTIPKAMARPTRSAGPP